MKSLQVFALLAAIAVVHAQLPHLPNIEYLGSGYDIYLGNPFATSSDSTVDPGFRAYVFDLTVYNTTITPDNRYSIPFGTDVHMCDSCSVTSSSSQISGTQSYQQSLAANVQANYSDFGFAFGGSADFKSVMQADASEKSVFVSTAAECCVYNAEISEYIPPPLSAEFKAAVKSLPESYEEAQYMKFVSYFGTHVVTYMTMGGRMGMRSSIQSGAWSQVQVTSINVELAAGFSLLSNTLAVSTMDSGQQAMAKSYNNFVDDNSFFMLGGQITANGSVEAWMASAASNPMPLSTQVTAISDLISSTYFPDEPQDSLNAKQNATLYALSAYCSWLMTQDLISQCKAPGEDPPMPASSNFRGFYSVSSNVPSANSVNPFTGQQNCPSGAVSVSAGSFYVSINSNGYTYFETFLCLQDGVLIDPTYNFGGLFQSGDPNPVMNGATGCPSGVSDAVGIADVGEATMSVLYACINNTQPLSYGLVGGYYSTSVAHGYPNYYTNANSCPQDYCAEVMMPNLAQGEVYSSTVYVCIACAVLQNL